MASNLELRNRLGDLWEQQRRILDAAEANGRDLTQEEEQTFDRIEEEMRKLDGDLTRLDRHDARGRVLSSSTGGAIKPTPDGSYSDEESTVAVLAPEQRFADYVRGEGLIHPDDDKLSLGKYLRGLVTGDWSEAEAEKRAMAEGVLAEGGYMVPTPLAALIIDRARNATRVIEAGAVTVPMESQTLKVARVAGDPTAAWKSENAAASESDMEFEVVTFTAQTLLALVRSSREVLEDASGIDEALANAFGAALGLELDRAALRGSGTPPEPRGVLNTTGITSNTIGAGNGATPTYDDLIDKGLGPIEDNNFQPNAFMQAPRTGRTFAKTKDLEGRYLEAPEKVREVRKLETNQIPITLTVGSSSDCSEIYTGQWSQLMLGIRHSLEINVLRERYAEYYQFGFLAHLRADVQVAQPKAFSVIKGVRP